MPVPSPRQPRPQSGRWFGIGGSHDPDPAAAGIRATRQATAGHDDPALLIVYATIDVDIPDVAQAVRRECPGRPRIVGCSTDGQLSGFGTTPSGVTVAALGGPGFAVELEIGRGASADPRSAGATSAGAMARIDRPQQMLLVLSDGLIGHQHDMVRGAYSEVGATVPLVGGCAADRLDYQGTYLIYGDESGVEVVQDAVIGVALGSDARLGLGIAHGWSKVGDPLTATRSAGGRLYELDGERALDVYLDRAGIPATTLTDRAAFRDASYGHPLGMSRRSGEDIRVVHDFDPDDGSLLCLADVPQGALTWLMRTDDESLIGAAVASCQQALGHNSGPPPLGVLLFDCGARKSILGPVGTATETDQVRRLLGDVPFAGFYTYGEIARVHGARGMHHMTVVSLALW